MTLAIVTLAFRGRLYELLSRKINLLSLKGYISPFGLVYDRLTKYNKVGKQNLPERKSREPPIKLTNKQKQNSARKDA